MPHAFSNPGDVPSRALVTNSPDIGQQYFRDVAAVMNAAVPPDKVKLLQVMQQLPATLQCLT